MTFLLETLMSKLIYLQILSKRITSNKTKHLLVENELKKLKPFDLSYFKGKGHFEEDVTQNYLVFQPMYIYFKRIAGVGSGNYVYIFGNLKDCLMKRLILLLHLIIVLLQDEAIMVVK